MDVDPVKRNSKVKYPSSSEANKILLNRIPKGWRHNKVVAAALVGAGIYVLVRPIFIPAAYAGAMRVRYLTERDAIEIAKVEAQKMGLKLESRKYDIKLNLSTDGDKPDAIDYTLDAYDKKAKVGFEFVTKLDGYVLSDSEKTDEAKCAEAMRQCLKKGKLDQRILVVPLPMDLKTDLKAQQEQVRLKIREFLMWLKGQGVI